MKNIVIVSCVISLFFSTNTIIAQTNLCSNSKCHGGKIFCEVCDGAGMDGSETCRKCNGNGFYSCPTCSGNGSVSTGNTTTTTTNVNATSGSSSTRHQYTCPECKGEKEIPTVCPNPKCRNGAIYCEVCDYSGSITRQCDACSGKGEITREKNKPCPYCHGKKYIKKEKQEPCTHCRNGKVPRKNRVGETEWVIHTECKGTGSITSTYNATCRPCAGTGVNGKETYTEECKACEGKGSITETCTQCNGKRCYPCPTCDGYANIRTPCSRCKGHGVIYTK